jgi:multidrug efflux pump subunit AcrA (membrane-fusion protein)
MKKLIVMLTSVLVLAACGEKNEPTLEQVETDVFTVQTETVARRDISQDLLLTGSVRALEEAVIYPRVDGKLLKNVLREGDPVKRNETIALVERDEVGAVYEPVVVPSTLTGVVGRTYLDPGANVTKTTAVALVVNQETVRILVDIPERYIGKIRLKQKATFTVEAYGSREFEAVIYKLSPVVDTQSRVVSAELKAENKDGAIKSGMFAKVKLQLDYAHNASSVSTGALSTDAETGGNYLFFVNGGTVAKTPVQAGIASDKFVQIKSGANDGQEVAKVTFGLKDGSKIKVENKQPYERE